MDKQSQWDKLFKMSPEPPTEFPRTQCLNKPITYRESCIDYVKKTMRCVSYRDYLVNELQKLEKIEQIVNSWNGSIVLCENDWKYISAIKEVLEQE